jgi:5'-AMP-activated protein kinase, catalytic alpha subunit
MSAQPEKTVPTKTYLILKNLGEGSFGKVKEALHVLTQEKIAVKVLEKSRITTDEEKTRVKREIDILRRIRHPYIVQLYEVIETDKYHFLVMEHMDKGELADYIEDRGKVSLSQTAIRTRIR